MKGGILHIIVIGGCLSLISGCSRQKPTVNEVFNPIVVNPDGTKSFNRDGLTQWIVSNKSKLEVTREMEEVQYTLRYLPHEYMAMLEAGRNAPDSVIIKDMNHYSGMQSFNLRIQIKDFQAEPIKYKLKSEQQYDARVKYCAFGMQYDISLIVDDKDTVPCKLFHFERTFDAQPICSFMIGFPNELINKNDKNYHVLTLMYEDKLFGKGIVKFRFDRSDIENIQQLTAI